MSLIEDKPPTRGEQYEPERSLDEARRPAGRLAPTPTSRARARPRWFRKRWVVALLALVAIGLIIGAVAWWTVASRWVSTDDAFIDTHTVQVSTQVAGRVQAVLIEDNEEVRAGQPLLELDPADFQAALSQALANQQSAEGQLAQAEAQLPVARANLDEAKAQITVAQAATVNAETNLKRDRMLARMGGLAVSQQTIDNDAATARSDAANQAAAQQKALAAQAQIGLDEKNIQTAEAAVRASAAQVQRARLNVGYTVLHASANGRITNKTVAVGDYVQVGQALMALVPDRVWVTANFKETELGEMKIGDPVDIYVDAYPGQVFKGKVQSFQTGSGAAFSLLPPENATGNYVKVVQRVPVKIVFEHDPDAHWLLGPGMSVEPYVRVR